MKQVLSLILLAVSLTSCVDEDIVSPSWNEDSFEPINSLQPFSEVIPAYDFDYWELVHHVDQKDFVQFGNGSICKDAEDPLLCASQFYQIEISQLNDERPLTQNNGGDNYYYLRSNEQGYNKYWHSREEISAFLGAIDSKGDALLIAAFNGYFFEKEDTSSSGIRQDEKNYHIIALKVVSRCSPYQVNKVLLEVDQNARLKILDERIHAIDAHACLDDQKNE